MYSANFLRRGVVCAVGVVVVPMTGVRALDGVVVLGATAIDVVVVVAVVTLLFVLDADADRDGVFRFGVVVAGEDTATSVMVDAAFGVESTSFDSMMGDTGPLESDRSDSFKFVRACMYSSSSFFSSSKKTTCLVSFISSLDEIPFIDVLLSRMILLVLLTGSNCSSLQDSRHVVSCWWFSSFPSVDTGKNVGDLIFADGSPPSLVSVDVNSTLVVQCITNTSSFSTLDDSSNDGLLPVEVMVVSVASCTELGCRSKGNAPVGAGAPIANSLVRPWTIVVSLWRDSAAINADKSDCCGSWSLLFRSVSTSVLW